jgi:hypothetical protein
VAGIVVVGLAVACTVAGLVVLLLPYDHDTRVAGLDERARVRCQAPLVDAVSTKDAEGGWFLLDEHRAVTFTDDVDATGAAAGTISTGGSLCYPDSVQRAAIGAGLVTVGATALVTWRLLRGRRRPDEDDELLEAPDEVRQEA